MHDNTPSRLQISFNDTLIQKLIDVCDIKNILVFRHNYEYQKIHSDD